MTDRTYSADVLTHLRDLLSSDPYGDFYKMSSPEAGRDSFALIHPETGQVFIVNVKPGKILCG